MTQSHSPTPWHLTGKANIRSEDFSYICVLDQRNRETNAAFIIQAVNAHDDLIAALDQIFSRVSYVNIHGVGEQPEPSPLGPQPVRVSKEEFSRLFQEIGTIAATALTKAAP